MPEVASIVFQADFKEHWACMQLFPGLFVNVHCNREN
jgi:hypothetical protein